MSVQVRLRREGLVALVTIELFRPFLLGLVVLWNIQMYVKSSELLWAIPVNAISYATPSLPST